MLSSYDHLFPSNLLSRYSKKLGEQLADLHLHNKRQMEKQEREQQTVGNVTSTWMQILTTHIHLFFCYFNVAL